MSAFDRLELVTARLTLRPLRAGDAEALHAIFSDPRVMAHWSTGPWTSLDPAHQMIVTDSEVLPAGIHLRLGIVDRATRGLCGTCTLFNLNAACRRAEIGYALAHAAWGRGFMHEALTALLNYGFDAMELNRVEADIDPANRRSERTLEWLGFQREGLLRENWIIEGEPADSAIFGLLAREWHSRTLAR